MSEKPDWKRLAICVGSYIEALEMHMSVQSGTHGADHAAEGQKLRSAGRFWIEKLKEAVKADPV